ncbi:MAG: hypothetical protein AABY22_10430 [Nanoarchaeota archaeon]
MKTKFQIQGKKNRQSGGAFERKVRDRLEKEGWVVSKWLNNVELGKNIPCPDNKEGCLVLHQSSSKLISAKHKFNPFMKVFAIGTGFPDFICFRGSMLKGWEGLYYIQGVECKSNGILSKEEKEKCKWLIENNIFGKIIIVSKGDKRGEIIYNEIIKEKVC